MSDGNQLFYGPEYYSFVWVLVGIVSLGVAIGLIAMIFYVTRKKTMKSLKTLKPLAPKVVDLNELKQKYLGLIEQVVTLYNDHRITASVAHQHLSKLVRLFYYEALGFHAEVMTLSDLKKTRHEELTKVIGDYYPDEFDTLEKGLVAQSAEKARELVEKQ